MPKIRRRAFEVLNRIVKSRFPFCVKIDDSVPARICERFESLTKRLHKGKERIDISPSHILKTCGVFSLLLSPAQFRNKSTMNHILTIIHYVVKRARKDGIEFHDVYYEMCLSRVICAFAMSTLVSSRTRKPSRIYKQKNVTILCRYMFKQDLESEASCNCRRLLAMLSRSTFLDLITPESTSCFDIETTTHLARFGCIEKMEQEESYVKGVVRTFLSGKSSALFPSPSSSSPEMSNVIRELSSDVAFFFVFLCREYEHVRIFNPFSLGFKHEKKNNNNNNNNRYENDANVI